MDYYKKRMVACRSMKELIEKNERMSFTELSFNIGERFGFGKRMVKDYVGDLEKLGFVEVNGEDVFWQKNQSSTVE